MTAVVQRNMAGGEISPSMWGRVDLVKYATGAATIRNWIVSRHGGLKNRPGTDWVCHSRNMSDKIRLVPFKVSKTETYINVHSAGFMRVIQNGALVTKSTSSFVITNATDTNPCVLTITSHTLVIGDEFVVDDVVGMIELNGRNFKVLNTAATDLVTIGFLNGDNIDATNFTDYVSGGTADLIFEIVSPYVVSDLPEIHKSQTAAVMTLTHEDHEVRNLTRIAVDDWLLVEETFLPKVDHAQNAAGAKGNSGSLTFKYKVTSVDPEDFQESLPALEAEFSITGVTIADPVVIAATGHDFVEGDTVELNSLTNGAEELNNIRFTVGSVNAAVDFELKDEDGTGVSVWVSGGKCAREEITILAAAAPTVANPHVITWDAVAGIKKFSIYKLDKNGEFGFLGVAVGTEFKDDGVTDPSINDTPPQYRNPFRGTGNFPLTSGYYQQRRGFGGPINDTEKLDFSETGDFKGFRRRSPLQDDDAVRFKIEGNEINGIRHIIQVNGKLAILTESGEWLIRGDANGTLTPIEVNPSQHSYNGASRIQPVIIDNTALYVQELDSTIREFNFSFDVDGLEGDDLTINSAHLFDNFGIVAIAYQKVPHSILWVVRNDGVMLGLTFNKSQKMVAWHRHDIEGGLIEDAAVVREGNEEALYIVVKYEMDITGTDTTETVRNVERMNTHKIVDIKDWVFVDSAKTVDGRNTNSSHKMTLSGGVTWDHEETLTLTSSASFFLVGMKNDADIIQMTGTRDTTHPVTGKTIKVPIKIDFKIEGFTSDTVVTVRAAEEVPASLQAVATSSWSHAITVVGGAWHLEGEAISIFADAFVIASAKNNKYDDFVVENGTFILGYPRAVITYGRPLTSDFETLDIDTVGGETLADKKKIINNVTVYMNQSMGLWAGPKAPEDDDNDATEGLEEIMIGGIEESQDPIPPLTGATDIPMNSEYSNGGRVFLRNLEPVPAEILQVVPRGKLPILGGGR